MVPADIRYDDQIPANAKLLYAEISSLTNKLGYCFAPDSYFAGLYRMTERSIRRLITTLEERGYIRVEREAGERNKTLERRIYAGLNPLAGVGSSLDKNVQTGGSVRTKLSGSSDKIVQTHNITSRNNNTCSRHGGSMAAASWKPERFEAFWKFYRGLPGKDGRPRNENRQRAIQAWDRLRPDEALIARIGKALKRQMATDEWKRGIGIPQAATYLNGARWTDAEELPAVSTADTAPAYDPRGGLEEL